MVLGHAGERGFRNTKNNTNEASMFLKIMKCLGNEAKKYMKTHELYQNTGNEAKNLLKTNHIALLSG